MNLRRGTVPFAAVTRLRLSLNSAPVRRLAEDTLDLRRRQCRSRPRDASAAGAWLVVNSMALGQTRVARATATRKDHLHRTAPHLVGIEGRAADGRSARPRFCRMLYRAFCRHLRPLTPGNSGMQGTWFRSNHTMGWVRFLPHGLPGQRTIRPFMGICHFRPLAGFPGRLNVHDLSFFGGLILHCRRLLMPLLHPNAGHVSTARAGTPNRHSARVKMEFLRTTSALKLRQEDEQSWDRWSRYMPLGHQRDSGIRRRNHHRRRQFWRSPRLGGC